MLNCLNSDIKSWLPLLFVAIYMNAVFSNYHPFDIPDYETLTTFHCVLF